MTEALIAFGPVPSRRLGYSLGVNHVPPKHCTYSCVYCQVGRTTRLETDCREFYPVEKVVREVGRKISDCRTHAQPIDYLTLVPDGEPTLDCNLGKLIAGLKPFGIPIAVISNATLIDHEVVQEALLQADWVSLKVDAVGEAEWRRVNRPHPRLSLPAILNGALAFRRRYSGVLVTESMLVAGVNDGEAAIRNLAAFLLELQPVKSYLSIPIRPPAEGWVRVPDANSLQQTLDILSERWSNLDVLFDAEASEFNSTGDIVEDILGIVAVHPLRETALRKMLERAGVTWGIVENLIAGNLMTRIDYRGERFYCAGLRASSRGHQAKNKAPA